MSGNMTPHDLPNDWVLTIPLEALSAAGIVVPFPAGDTPTVASSGTGINAIVGLTDAGGAAIILNATVDGSLSKTTVYTIKITDSAGLIEDDVTFIIVPDKTPVTILADIPDSSWTQQAVPPPG